MPRPAGPVAAGLPLRRLAKQFGRDPWLRRARPATGQPFPKPSSGVRVGQTANKPDSHSGSKGHHETRRLANWRDAFAAPVHRVHGPTSSSSALTCFGWYVRSTSAHAIWARSPPNTSPATTSWSICSSSASPWSTCLGAQPWRRRNCPTARRTRGLGSHAWLTFPSSPNSRSLRPRWKTRLRRGLARLPQALSNPRRCRSAVSGPADARRVRRRVRQPGSASVQFRPPREQDPRGRRLPRREASEVRDHARRPLTSQSFRCPTTHSTRGSDR